MTTISRAAKLSIIEPWEFGTERPIDVSVIDFHAGQYLIALATPLSIHGKNIKFLLGQPRSDEFVDILSRKSHGTIALNMVYSDEINENNFRDYSIKNFRGNFLVGEVVI